MRLVQELPFSIVVLSMKREAGYLITCGVNLLYMYCIDGREMYICISSVLPSPLSDCIEASCQKLQSLLLLL